MDRKEYQRTWAANKRAGVDTKPQNVDKKAVVVNKSIKPVDKLLDPKKILPPKLYAQIVNLSRAMQSQNFQR